MERESNSMFLFERYEQSVKERRWNQIEFKSIRVEKTLKSERQNLSTISYM